MVDILRKCYLFSGLDDKRILRLVRELNAKVTEYKKGETVIVAGSLYNDISVVLSGEFCISQYCENGKEQLIQKAKPSYLIGVEISVSKKKDSPYTVYCSKDASLLSFPAEAILNGALLSDNDRYELFKRALEFLANENMRKFHKIEIISIRSSRQKIVLYLSLQQKRFQSNTFSIEYNREELASYLDLNRSVLSHELKAMEKEGLITVHKNKFTIL